MQPMGAIAEHSLRDSHEPHGPSILFEHANAFTTRRKENGKLSLKEEP